MKHSDQSNLLKLKLKKERHSLALNPKISSFNSVVWNPERIKIFERIFNERLQLKHRLSSNQVQSNVDQIEVL